MSSPTFQPTSLVMTNITTTDDYYTFKEGIVWARGSSIVMFALSLSSILLPLSAGLSILLFRKERSKSSMRILLFKFSADVLTSCGSIVGNPFSGSRACWFEGIVTNIFTLASILWTGVIMLLLYSILAFKKPLNDHWSFHVLCWGFPVIATIIPFSTSTYGAPGGLGWCWVVSKDDDPPEWEAQLWYWLSFYLYVWSTMIFILIVSLRIILRLKSPDMKESTRIQFFQIFYKLLGYPAIIFICWLPSTISDYITNANPNDVLPTEFSTATTSLDCLMGFLSGLYFWLVNRGFHENWKNLYSVRFNMHEYEEKFSQSTGGSSKSGRSRYLSMAPSSVVQPRSRGSISSVGVDIYNALASLAGPKKENMVYAVDDDGDAEVGANHNHRSSIALPSFITPATVPPIIIPATPITTPSPLSPITIPAILPPITTPATLPPNILPATLPPITTPATLPPIILPVAFAANMSTETVMKDDGASLKQSDSLHNISNHQPETQAPSTNLALAM